MTAPNLDISATLVAKSDQLNADDLIGGPITVRVEAVSISDGEQPVIIRISNGYRPWKPCKTMRRLLAALWGANGNEWVGRRLTLYRDSSVTFGPDAVGGIRISHMSNISRAETISLSAKKGKKAPHTVKPLPAEETGMDMAAFQRALAAAARTHGWTRDQVIALLDKHGTGGADGVPANRRAEVAELVKGPPPTVTEDPPADDEVPPPPEE